MPQGDKTGPNGQGPMTGRRMGLCAGFNAPGFVNNGCRKGFGRGRGWRFQSPIENTNQEQEKQILENQKELIEKRLKELE